MRMKGKVARIYDKNKAKSRKKYLIIIVAILALQVALYVGMFSKAEGVIPVKYTNYYTLESVNEEIAVETDLSGKYIVLPSEINNRFVLKYYIEQEGNIEEYNPNDIYRITDDQEMLNAKVEYGESVVDAYNNGETEQVESDDEIIDVVYLGECGQEGEEGTELNPYKSIEAAFKKLPATGGKIIIKGTADIDSWGSSSVATNKDVIIEGYNSESKINMLGNWVLQGNTQINNIKINMTENTKDLAIYANGYTLVIGTEGNNESVKISAKDGYYPHVYGGTNQANISRSTNVTIHSGTYQSIYAGSNNKNITGNTNLNITYAAVYGGVFGGSNTGTISGNTNVSIVTGIYGITLANDKLAVSGGAMASTINGTTTLTVADANVVGGYVAGAGNASVKGAINTTLTNIKLGENGDGNASIYGAGYTGGSTARSSGVKLVIDGIEGNPKQIIGYANSGGANETGTVEMNLKNINSSSTEIYGGMYNGTQTKGSISKITVENVKAKVLSAGGTVASSIKNYNMTVNSGCNFTQGIYAGVSTNSVSNVVNGNNTLRINSYGGQSSYKKLYFQNKSATMYLNNSYIDGTEKFYYASLYMTNSKLQIGSLGSSFGQLSIDEKSELTIGTTKSITVNGKLSGKGTFRVEDTSMLTILGGIDSNIKMDIIENENNAEHYINVIANEKAEEDELYFNPERTNYKTDFTAGSTSYWKFYTGETGIVSKANCVYLDQVYGDDNNAGTLKEPVKSIEAASKIIKNDATKTKVVIISDLDLNKETQKVIDASDKYTTITATDGSINFRKSVVLSGANFENNIYQNIEFVSIPIKTNPSNSTQNIFANGNKLKISGSVSVTGTVNIYGGSNSKDVTGNTNLNIASGTWNNIYGGSNSGVLTGDTNVTVTGGTINSAVYGGGASGDISGNTNLTVSGGTIKDIVGGSVSGDISGNINCNISKGTITGNIYGANKGTQNNVGEVSGQVNLSLTGGTFSTNTTSIYGAGQYGIVNNVVTTISKFSTAKPVTIYGGGQNVTQNGEITLNIENSSSFTGKVLIYGGSENGTISDNINVNLKNSTFSGASSVIYGGSKAGVNENIVLDVENCTFGAITVYRGADSATVNGDIASTIKNIKFTSTSSALYFGSNSGTINGNVEAILETGMFASNACNAKVYSGSNSGTINGNVSLNTKGITFNNDVYGGSNTGSISGTNIHTAESVTLNNVYGLTPSLATTGNKFTLKNSTVKKNMYVLSNTGTNQAGNVEASIETSKLNTVYAFKTYTAMNKNLDINITNSTSSSNAEIILGTVEGKNNTNLKGILTYTLNNNNSSFMFEKSETFEHLNINGATVIAKDSMNLNELTLKNEGSLDLEKASTVSNDFNGDTSENYGEIYVYDGLNIGVASGKTILRVGTIVGDISSPNLSFVKYGNYNTNISVSNDPQGTKTWTVGSLNSLNVVYVNGTSGRDENSGETADKAVQTLATAYLYCAEGGTIVVSGSTTVTAWPTHTDKSVTITSKYSDVVNGTVDYRNTAKLVLDFEDISKSAILEADTIFNNIIFSMSKAQSIFASGYKLTLGDSIKVVDASGNETTSLLSIYGGGYNKAVDKVNLEIYDGTYKAIYGGSNANVAIGNEFTKGAVVQDITIDGASVGDSDTGSAIICGNSAGTSADINGAITLNISNTTVKGNILSSGYGGKTYGNVNVNVNKNVTVTGKIFADKHSGNIASGYSYNLKIDGTGGNTTVNDILYGSVEKYPSSPKYNTDITNASVTNIYYGSQNNTKDATIDNVKGSVEINLNTGAKVANIYGARYSADTTAAGNFKINVNTNEELVTNISRNSTNKGGKAEICEVVYKDKNTSVSGIFDDVTKVSAENTTLNIGSKQYKVLYTSLMNSTLNITGEQSNNLGIGTLEVGNNSTVKVLSNLSELKLSGDFIGGGSIYLNDETRVEIAGSVKNSTKVYCNNPDKYFEKGVRIVASLHKDTPDNAFVTPSGEKWRYKDSTTSRFWQISEFNINNVIYVNSETGKGNGLGTIDLPVNSLDSAYSIANIRYGDNKLDNLYYIVLQTSLNVSNNIKSGLKLDDNIEVVITNKLVGEDETIDYPDSVLNISTAVLDFVGKTTLENLKIKTTKAVEFFANGNDVTFGKGLDITSPDNNYPIIYGGGNTNNVTTDTIDLKVLSGKYNMIFGGGKEGNVDANINLTIGGETGEIVDVTQYGKDDDSKTGVFGAGRTGSVVGDITVTINSGNFHRVYGAGLSGTTTGNVTVNFRGGTSTRLYGGGQNATVNGDAKKNTGNATINLGNGSGVATISSYLRGSGQYSGVFGATTLNIYNGAVLSKDTQVAAGGYQGNAGSSNLNVYGGTIECNLYGGGWGNIGDPSKGKAGETSVHIYSNAQVQGDIYGGGYAGTADSTNVIVENATLNNVYGGGNQAKIEGNTSVRITSAKINENVYGGGNGTIATVKGNTTVIIDGNTIIAGNLFGGGNAASTGVGDDKSNIYVNIVGGTINGDVYGGANTAVVVGDTNVRIGDKAVEISDLTKSDISILGTVFGGGRSNEAGSEDYDFTFESVTGNVYIDIDNDEAQIDIAGSVFASGNAAKISGDGYINILNYGTNSNPKKLISIQRATEVNVQNSTLWIAGTTDRTNEISTAIYTINRVKDLALKDNSVVYLSSGVNLVENLYSLDSNDELEVATIEDGTISQNVNNKLYVLHGKNIILSTEDGGNGSVHGMMFLGKFDEEQGIGKNEGIYSSEYNVGDSAKTEDINALNKNSYLQAQHYTKHDIYVDGFYTNIVSENNTIIPEYIIPTPEVGTYYQWMIGEESETIYYEDIELIASKYSATAQATIDLVELNAPDMVLEVIGIDTSLLKQGVILVDEAEIPNIAEYSHVANAKFGLTMENGHQGWKANGKTGYLYDGNEASIKGTKYYYAEKSITTPTIIFNFVHSKNVSEDLDLGKVTVMLKARYTEDGETIIKNINIELNLNVKKVESEIDYYEGAITPGLKYSTFPNATTNITSKSSISTYYSIYLEDYDTTKFNENYEGYYHAVTSTFALPEGTKIIMIDKSKNVNDYYYYIVSKEDEISQKKSYKFTDFIEMGTLDKHYNKDASYYDKDKNSVLEEFVFQVNFENTTIKQDYLRQSFKIELIDSNKNEVRLTVNDAIYPVMYNLYANQETEKIMTVDKYEMRLHKPEDIDFTVNTTYNQKIVNANVVYDTTNFDNAAGLKVTFYSGTEQMTQEELGGLAIKYNDSYYFVGEDNAISFKISDIVSNVETNMKVLFTQKGEWEKGTYTMKIEAISSADGVHASNSIMSKNVTIVFSSSDYGLDAILGENSQIIDKDTGITLDGNNILDFDVKYETGLENPNIRVSLYRRAYNENIYTTDYELVDLAEYVETSLESSNNNQYEYMVTNSPVQSQKFTLSLKENLISGTYKMKFLIYDGQTYIGEVYKMIIIR